MSDDTYIQAMAALREGKIEEAIEMCKESLRQNHQHVGALRMLGGIALSKNELEDVVHYFGKALEFSDPDPDIEYNLGIACRKLGRQNEAAEWFSKTISHKRDYAQAYRMLAETLELQNRTEEALETARSGFLLEPDDPHLSLVMSKCECRGGNVAGAFDRLDRIMPIAGDCEINQRILYERGRLLDLLNRPDEAVEALRTANDMAARIWHGINPGNNQVLDYVQHSLEAINQTWADSWQPSMISSEEPDPVFLVGFPRSGTTLLNRMLDMHPGIKVASEMQVINRIYETLVQNGHRIPEDLPTLDEAVQMNAQNYYKKAMSEICESTFTDSVIVDKLPLHIIFTPLIHRLFPKAKYLLVLRHPYDVCFSCFMSDFEHNSAMANFHSLENSARFYAATMEVWQKSTNLFSLNYHTVKYESLVDDPESETRQICSFLGVDWYPELLDFHSRGQHREIKVTPSYHQVNRPVYLNAKYRWKNYTSHLADVRSLLDPCVEVFGYAGQQE